MRLPELTGASKSSRDVRWQFRGSTSLWLAFAGLSLVAVCLLHPRTVPAQTNTAEAAADGERGNATDAKRGGSVEGVVIRVADGEVVVDLGRRHGLHGAARVEVYRRLEVEHPVSGETLVDRFPIGDMPLDQVGELLSITRTTRGLQRQPAVGDYVVFEVGDNVAEPGPDGRHPGDTKPGQAPDTTALERTFARTLGSPIDTRIELYEAFVTEFPESDHVDSVVAELRSLYAFREELRRAAAAPDDPKAETAESMAPDPLVARVAAPPRASTTDPIAVAISIADTERVQLVRVLIRQPLSEHFEAHELQRIGALTWGGELPDSWTRRPGELQVAFHVVHDDGETTEFGKGGRPNGAPLTVGLEEPVEDIPDRRRRSRVSAIFEYVDFWLDGDTDAYLRFESDFRYLIDFGILRAFRIGVGIFQGEGGAVDAIEAGEPGRERNVNYGYSEVIFEFHPYFGTSVRLSAGNYHQTERGTAESVIGVGGEMRIGRDDGTRLLLGGAFTEQIGNEGWIELVLEEIERIPMDFGVVVTNLPVDADLGVSLYYGAGWQITDFIAVSARIGWNARTINHFGLTGGAGTVLTW